MKKRKLCLTAAIAGALASAAVFPSFAAETISTLNMSFETTYGVGEVLEPEITMNTSGVSIDSISWNKKTENWKPGSKVTATIYLSSDSGDEFLSSYGERSFRISGAELGSAKQSDDRLKVTVYYYPVVQLEAPEEAGWSNLEKTVASWEKSEYATGYQLKLYRDGTYIRTLSTKGTSMDLSEYMTEAEGIYTYEVRAIPWDTGDADCMRSSEYTASSDRVVDDLGDTDGDWKLYAEGKKYRQEDGTFVTGQWYKIHGLWYYFGDEGYAASGWLKDGDTWYYLGSDGVMQTGWVQLDGVWYYLNEDGSMATGWCQTAPGQWYYLNEDGSMASNASIDGRTLDETGLWVQ